MVLSNLMANLPTLAWDLGSFLDNAGKTLETWAGYIIVIIGVVCVAVGVYKIASGLISHGKKQVNWPVAIILILLGGALLAGGWYWVVGIAKGGQQTIEDLGGGSPVPAGTIIPMLSSYFSL